MLELAPKTIEKPSPFAEPGRVRARDAEAKGRVALLTGCAQPVLNPGINEATIRLLRRGLRDRSAEGEVCCGALVHHMGKEEASLENARRNVDVWMRESTGRARRHHHHRVRLRHDDQGLRPHAARGPGLCRQGGPCLGLAKDITEYPRLRSWRHRVRPNLTVAYHSACSMQHGQKITASRRTF
jgi:glycolate oxidase iron-sulfur subunit